MLSNVVSIPSDWDIIRLYSRNVANPCIKDQIIVAFARGLSVIGSKRSQVVRSRLYASVEDLRNSSVGFFLLVVANMS